MNKMYKKVILDNGIKLYVHTDKTMKRSIFSYTVSYGSSGEYFKFNYDNKDYEVLPGCAHFLEHYLLEHSKYGDICVYFKGLNYTCNALTGDKITKYFFEGTKNIKSSIKKMITALEYPKFNEEEVREASHAIEEETKRGLNDPFWIGLNKSIRNLYKNFDMIHESLGRIGNEETTKSIHADLLKLCYDAFYYDDNKTIVYAGPIDEDEIIDYIKRIYNKINKHENKLKLLVPNNLLEIRNKENNYVSNAVEDPYLFIGFNQSFKDFSIFEISSYINFIFNSKFSSKTEFYNKLKKEGILVYSMGAYKNYIFDEGYCFDFIFTTKDINRMLNEFKNEFNKNNFTKKEFDLFKRQELSNYLYLTEDKYFYYDRIPFLLADFKEVIDYPTEINKLTFERFIDFYKSIDYNNSNTTVVVKED